MFREFDKVNTDISETWRRAALLVSFASITITLNLGIAYFGEYLRHLTSTNRLRLLIFHTMFFLVQLKIEYRVWLCLKRIRFAYAVNKF